MAHVKSPSFSAKDTVTKKSSNDNLNSNQSTKPTSVKVISIKSNGGNNPQQQSKFVNDPSGQSSHAKSPNDNTAQKSDSGSATYNLNVTSSRRRDKHSRNSSAHVNNKSVGGNSSEDSKKHGNVDVQVSSPKSKDSSNQKGSSASTAENNMKTSTNESSIVPSPILSKRPKKRKKNTSAQVLSNSANNNNVKKDVKANEDSKSTENNSIGQRDVKKSTDNLIIDTKEFQSGASFTGEINNQMPADFKFDFASSSPLFISLPPSISGPKNYQNDESGPNLSAFESSSLDFKTPTPTTFDFSYADLFSKDFNINTSSIFNLQTSFSSDPPLFGSSNNNPPGSPILINGNANANLWTDPNPSNADTMINSNGSNGVRTTTASVEDLERQVANAKREAEVLELRLRAVIKKNTHHLQDAWK